MDEADAGLLLDAMSVYVEVDNLFPRKYVLVNRRKRREKNVDPMAMWLRMVLLKNGDHRIFSPAKWESVASWYVRTNCKRSLPAWIETYVCRFRPQKVGRRFYSPAWESTAISSALGSFSLSFPSLF